MITTAVICRPDASVSSRSTCAFVMRSTFECSSAGSHAHRLRVGLAVDEAREAVDPVAADAAARVDGVAVVVLVEHHAERKVRRMVPELLEVVVELLDARLVLHLGIRIRTAARALGRVLPRLPVHVVEALGLRVPRLEVVVGQRPRGRDAAVMADLAEVLGPQPEQRRAVELRVAADVVVLLGRELVVVAGRATVSVVVYLRRRNTATVSQLSRSRGR